MKLQTFNWNKIDSFGTEHFRLVREDELLRGSGKVAYEEGNVLFHANYALELDAKWRTRKLKVEASGAGELEILSNGEGNWFQPHGAELEGLYGAIDVDLSVTPFTNSLPINRHEWEPGQKRNFEMVYVDVQHLSLFKVSQTYTFLEQKGGMRIFAYHCRDFESFIYVDTAGFVIEYPDLFIRKSDIPAGEFDRIR
ncbi:putative glycolipid-binding domain-containing protein [Metabacillus indicus]|uniref:putative glycolipid-binding domain-containing protein n=1 Tax=Metabacillus indicus TaxID=246786 RepID=UPI003CF76566